MVEIRYELSAYTLHIVLSFERHGKLSPQLKLHNSVWHFLCENPIKFRAGKKCKKFAHVAHFGFLARKHTQQKKKNIKEKRRVWKMLLVHNFLWLLGVCVFWLWLLRVCSICLLSPAVRCQGNPLALSVQFQSICISQSHSLLSLFVSLSQFLSFPAWRATDSRWWSLVGCIFIVTQCRQLPFDAPLCICIYIYFLPQPRLLGSGHKIYCIIIPYPTERGHVREGHNIDEALRLGLGWRNVTGRSTWFPNWREICEISRKSHKNQAANCCCSLQGKDFHVVCQDNERGQRRVQSVAVPTRTNVLSLKIWPAFDRKTLWLLPASYCGWFNFEFISQATNRK